MRYSICATLGLVVLISSPCAVAQNLAVNGEFDTDVSGWTPLGADFTTEWDPSDHNASPVSGSLLATNTSPLNASLAVVYCVNSIPDDQQYRFRGWVNVLPGQTASGQFEIWWDWFDNPSCVGTQVLAGATPIMTSTSGWEFVDTGWEAAPPGTMSAWLVLGNHKNVAGPGSFQTYYDGLDFRGDRIFVDGFESGNTDVWSNTVGF